MSGHDRDALSDQPLEFEVLERRRLFDGFRLLDKLVVRHAALDGEGTVGPVNREILVGGQVSVIVPYDPELDSIVLIRQFRIGAALRTGKPAALELPAGLIEEDEAPEIGAARELEEETGLKALAIERCFSMLPTPGLTDEHAQVFLALVDASQLGQAAGLAAEHEDIRPIAAKVDRLLDAVDEGRVENGFLIACCHWFARKGRARAVALSAMLEAEAGA